MKAGRFNGRKIITPRSQRGVILLIALIMLVAMTLAGIGMMRSIDTGSLVAGNMAFQRSTMDASDAGTNVAFANLMAVANGNPATYVQDRQILWNDTGSACPAGADVVGCPGGPVNFPGYYSTPINPCEVSGQTIGTVTNTAGIAIACSLTQNLWWTVAANWANAATTTVPDPNMNGGNSCPNGSAPGTNGCMTIQYFIHRMCQSPGVPTSTLTNGQLCQYYNPSANNCGAGSGCGNSGGQGGAQLTPPTVYYYRVTVRITGGRNTVSYAQTFVQQSM